MAKPKITIDEGKETTKQYLNGIPATFEKSVIVDDIIMAHSAFEYEFFNDHYDALINIEAVYGDHYAEYSDREVAEKFKDRLKVNLPTLYPKMQSLFGFQRANREVWESESVGGEDALLGQVVNAFFRGLERGDNPEKFKYMESDAFKDSAIARYGAMETYIKRNEKGENEITYRNWPYNQCYYDRAITSVNATECQKIQLFEDVYMDELMTAYPHIPQEEWNEMTSSWNGVGTVYRKELITALKTLLFNDSLHPEKKIVRKIIDYTIKYVAGYEAKNIMTNETYYFDKRSDAVAYGEEVINNLDMENLAQILKTGASAGELTSDNIENFEIVLINKRPKTMVQKTVIAGDVLLEEPYFIPIDELPVKLLFCLFFRGKVWSIVDMVRMPQQLIDRYYSHYDYALGAGSKSGGEVNVDIVAEEYNAISSLNQKFRNGDLLFKHGSGELSKPYQLNSIDPKMFEFSGLLSNILVDAVGGQNWQGVGEGKDQSGRAIQSLQKMAQMITIELLDNYARWKEAIGRVSIKLMKRYITNKTAVKIIGGQLTNEVLQAMKENKLYEESFIEDGLGTLVINDPELEYYQKNKIADSSFNISVRSVTSRQDEDSATLDIMMKLIQFGVQITPDVLIELMPIRPTTKSKILASMAKQQAIEQQQRDIEEKKLIVQGNLQQQHNLTGSMDVMARANEKEAKTEILKADAKRKIGNPNVLPN
jgi:hypothetical protein